MSTYPSTLPLPTQAGYSIQRNSNDMENAPATGTSFIVAQANDEPNLFSVQWLLSEAQYKVLHDWFYNELNAGVLSFTMPLWIESGISEQTAVFVVETFTGYATTTDGLYSVSAQIFVPSLSDPDAGEYATLVGLAEMSSDKDPETTMSLLDIIVNDIWPEV